MTPNEERRLQRRWEELMCWRMSHGLTDDEREELGRIEQQLEEAREAYKQ